MALLNEMEAQIIVTRIKHHFTHKYIDSEIEESNLLDLKIKITKLYTESNSECNVSTWKKLDNLCREHKLRPI